MKGFHRDVRLDGDDVHNVSSLPSIHLLPVMTSFVCHIGSMAEGLLRTPAKLHCDKEEEEEADDDGQMKMKH